MYLSAFVKCIIIIALPVLFTSCRKIDFKFRDPAQHCRIDQFNGVLSPGEPFEMAVTRKITYNEYGNPTLVEYVEIPDGTGTPSFRFFYNHNQQLIRMISYGEHRYTYNELGQIFIDSSYEYYAGGDARFETKFYYDLYGRIVKQTQKYYYDVSNDEGVGETITWLTKYDMRGNKIIPGVTYDNKTNINRTHPLWQFLNNDYSINNPVKATSYNSSGLPLTYGENTLEFLATPIFVHSIDYDCSDANK